MEDRHLSLSEVAGAMGVSERTVRRWIKSGKLRAYKPGRDYRIPESAVRALVEESEISPKAPSRSLFEPSFNDVLAEERREELYGLWVGFLHRYAARWEERIKSGQFDLGAVNEFIATVEDLGPALRTIEGRERREGTYFEPSSMAVALRRLLSLFNPLIAAGVPKFENSEIEQLRRKRAEQQAAFEDLARRTG